MKRKGTAKHQQHFHFFFHGEAEAAKFFRDGKAKQAERAHFIDKLFRYGVFFGHPRSAANPPGIDELDHLGGAAL